MNESQNTQPNTTPSDTVPVTGIENGAGTGTGTEAMPTVDYSAATVTDAAPAPQYAAPALAAQYAAPQQPAPQQPAPQQYAAPAPQYAAPQQPYATQQQPYGTQQQAYGAQTQFAPAPAPASNQGDAFAITGFVIGVVSIFAGYIFFPPIAGLIFGILARKRGTAHTTLNTWGIVLNSVILGIWAIIAAFFLAIGTFGIIASLPWVF